MADAGEHAGPRGLHGTVQARGRWPPRARVITSKSLRRAGVAELADAPDSKSGSAQTECGFDPRLRHQTPQGVGRFARARMRARWKASSYGACPVNCPPCLVAASTSPVQGLDATPRGPAHPRHVRSRARDGARAGRQCRREASDDSLPLTMTPLAEAPAQCSRHADVLRGAINNLPPIDVLNCLERVAGEALNNSRLDRAAAEQAVESIVGRSE